MRRRIEIARVCFSMIPTNIKHQPPKTLSADDDAHNIRSARFLSPLKPIIDRIRVSEGGMSDMMSISMPRPVSVPEYTKPSETDMSSRGVIFSSIENRYCVPIDERRRTEETLLAAS